MFSDNPIFENGFKGDIAFIGKQEIFTKSLDRTKSYTERHIRLELLHVIFQKKLNVISQQDLLITLHNKLSEGESL